MTRAQAFDWLGKNHWIPAMAGVNWLCDDLDRELASLKRGCTVALDYRNAIPEGPALLLARSTEDVITLQSSADTLGHTRITRRTWPSDLDDRLATIRFEVLQLLTELRGARAVVLVHPDN